MTVVNITPLVARGSYVDGLLYVALDDVSDYLETLAITFDKAGATEDIGRLLRTIRGSLAEASAA